MVNEPPRYPDVHVKLLGQDGNAFAILGRVSGALRDAGVPQPVVKEFLDEAMSSDYEHLLQTVLKWVNAS